MSEAAYYAEYRQQYGCFPDEDQPREFDADDSPIEEHSDAPDFNPDEPAAEPPADGVAHARAAGLPSL